MEDGHRPSGFKLVMSTSHGVPPAVVVCEGEGHHDHHSHHVHGHGYHHSHGVGVDVAFSGVDSHAATGPPLGRLDPTRCEFTRCSMGTATDPGLLPAHLMAHHVRGHAAHVAAATAAAATAAGGSVASQHSFNQWMSLVFKEGSAGGKGGGSGSSAGAGSGCGSTGTGTGTGTGGAGGDSSAIDTARGGRVPVPGSERTLQSWATCAAHPCQPRPHVILMLTSPGPCVTNAWQASTESARNTEISLALSALALYVPAAHVGALLTFLYRHVTPLLFHRAAPVRLEAALLTARA